MKLVRSAQNAFVPASHEDPRNPGVLKRVIATRDDIQHGQVMMVNWAQLPGGSSFRPHFHEDMQEIFLLVTGCVLMTVNNESVELAPGDTVIVDPKEVHEMTNLKSTVAEYVVFGVSSEQGGRTIVVG